jgi:Flp pilus assembly protein TadD
LGATRSLPLLAALIFALHPVCVESVAWISEEKNTLSTVFYLAAALLYLKWRSGGKSAHYACATLLFVCAILSKSVAATLPAALLVVLWWKQGRLSLKRDLLPLMPWFVLGAAAGLFTGWVERKFVGAQGPDFVLSFAQRGLIAGRAIWFYLGKLLWPANLIFIYPRWHVDPSAGWQYLFPLGVVALVVGLWAIRRRTRGPLAALLLFGGTLFPILGFFNIYAFIFSFVADHFQYLASLSVIALVVGGYGILLARQEGRSFLRLLPVLVVLLLGVLTWRQARMYRDRETFYQTILQRNPDSWMAQNNLGIALAADGRLPEAISHYEQAVRLKPTFPDVHNDLGTALIGVGRLPEALEEFRTALRLEPNYAATLGNLGDVLMQMGRTQEAVPDYLQELQLKPNDVQAHNNLGIAFAQSGRSAEAADQFAAAVRLDPDNTEIRINLGTTLAGLGRMAEARAQFEAVLQLKPGDAEAREALAHLPSNP